MNLWQIFLKQINIYLIIERKTNLNTLIINKNDLRHNINIIKNQVDIENYTIIGVVKGNGYGLRIRRICKIFNR